MHQCVFFEIPLGAPVLRAAPCSISSWELEFHWKKSPPVPTVGVMGVFCQNVWISTIFIPTQNGISVVLLNCPIDGCISIYDVCISLKSNTLFLDVGLNTQNHVTSHLVQWYIHSIPASLVNYRCETTYPTWIQKVQTPKK